MKKKTLQGTMLVIICATLVLGLPALAGAAKAKRAIDPIVSTDWLAANSGSPNLVILDVRHPDAFKAGHIPGSVSEPFGFPKSAWNTVRDKLLLEVPDTAELFKTIGGLGIKPDSRVVVVYADSPKAPAPFYGLADGTRVADTLIYAGVASVAILDGGFPKWQAEKRPVSTKAATPKAVKFDGAVDKNMFVSVDYVHKNLKSADILDARSAIVYFGAVVEPWNPKPGHIPGASSLPAPWIWQVTKSGLYLFKDSKTLAAMAAGALGKDPAKAGSDSKVIVYCGVGGYASSWWFVLTQVLGYKDVKFFDGASQEWGMHHDMVPYRWE